MKQFQRYLVFVAALLLIATSAFAQGTSSALTGTVTMEGNPLPGVTVTISSPALQGTRTAISDVNGNYNFGALPPGLYTVKFEMESMQVVTKQLGVTLAGTARSNADMRLSAVAEAITVTASAPAVLETTEVQTNLQSTLIADLPLNRNFSTTAALAPGVTYVSSSQLIISGAPSSESLYLVNGAVVNENVRSQIHGLYIEDAIQEQTVLTGSISAEYGRFSGGVVSAITKSGGNEFSGSLRDNFSKDSWRANTPVEELQGVKHPSVLNEVYEGTLGGRIIRDRLWFFGAGRYTKQTLQYFLQSLGSEQIPYTYGSENKRWEAKLTGQITPKHSLVASYLVNNSTESNYCFLTYYCEEYSNIDPARQTPNNFQTAHYNGILTSSFLLEAGYSKKAFTFQNSGGDFGDFAHGSWGYDIATGAFFGAPVFCGFCDPEKRDNRDYTLKATYYLATKGLGTHNLVGGYDDFAEQRKANNYQSGSNFEVYVFNAPERGPNGTVFPIIGEGDYIQWSPILALSKGSNLATKSTFFNDKWDFNTHFNFNIGVRYDKNDVKDSSGNKTSDDSAISPRLGLTYDFLGDGRYRINAGYNKYVSHIQETIGGSGASGSGNPAYFQYYYLGPTISGLPTVTAFQQLWDWFNAQCVGGDTTKCGTNNTDLLFGASVPGVSTKILHSLTSPNVTEYTIGIGSQLGPSAFARIDLMNRNFSDFYQIRADTSTGQVTDPFGNRADLGVYENGKDLKRTYKAAILQAGYRMSQRFNLGGNWTYSKTEGNIVGETAGSGPVADTSHQYPEYKSFAQNHPVGFLSADQKHKGRLWATYDIPTPIGRFTLGGLESYDTGNPYSEIGSIRPGAYVTNPGYVRPPATVNYYFSGRGDYRWETAMSTDLSLTYEFPIKKVSLWAKGDVLNTFNDAAVVSGNTTVLTATSTSCHQGSNGPTPGAQCLVFNPFTATPVLGVNYQRGSNFGKATSSANYQVPRTYRFSVGVRF